MEKIVVIGAGGMAKPIIDAIEREGRYELVGLLDSLKPAGGEYFGYPILGSEARLSDLDVGGGVISVGDNWTKFCLAEKIKTIRPDFTFVTVIHPLASVGRGSRLGEGTVVMALACITSDVRIGRHCNICIHSVLSHDCVIGDYCDINPNAALAGNAVVGSFSTVGIGATVLQGVKIGEHTIIGAGSTVTRDIGSQAVAYGTPCKVIRARSVGEKYL